MTSPTTRHRGYTLAELTVSLSIFAFMAMSITSLMFASYRTNRYVKAETDTLSQVDQALRRMVDNFRSGANLGNSFSTTCLDVVTQADPDNANLKYNVTYAVGSDGCLYENHTLYGSNLLVPNVGSTGFSVRVYQSSKPTMVMVTLTAQQPGGKAITRQACMTSRNF